jgi:flagellar motor switch protein FliN/FliY
MLAASAATAATTLGGIEPLTAGEPTRDSTPFESLGPAVLAPFTGTVIGELVVVADDELVAALHDSALGPLDLAAALAPTLESVARQIGPVTLGPAQVLDTRLALHRVLAYDDSGIVPLASAEAPRAAVAIGVEPAAAPTAALPSVTPAPLEDLSASRLDLLRGVEMEATAELGRARMTVNELLGLHSGAVIELDRIAGAPSDLYVNGRLIARGEVVVIDENYGLRITQVVTDDTGR